MKKSMIALLTAGILTTTLFGATVHADETNTSAKTVTVSASASVYTTPDKAEITIGCVSQGDDVKAVAAENTDKSNAVTEALKNLGIEDTSIQTSGYDLSPIYDYESPDNKITGYQATVSITISDLTIEEIGNVIKGATDAGATQINSVRYLCSDYDERYDEALTKAVAAAKHKAETLASAAGTEVSDFVSITEGYQDTSAMYKTTGNMAAMESSMDSAAISFNPGQTEISAQVTVVYGMK